MRVLPSSRPIILTNAREVGADAETIYTMESAEEGASYTDRMRDNLEKIYRSLQ